MKDFKHAVYIGRFQPFHNGHLAVAKKALEIADHLIVVVGSVNMARSIKNPWAFAERQAMIASSLTEAIERPNFSVVGVRDYHYNENHWVAEVQAKTDQFIDPGESVALLGEWKDASSYYLKHFPQWEFVKGSVGGPSLGANAINATSLRDRLLREMFGRDWQGRLPEARGEDMYEVVKHLPVPKAVRDQIRDWCFNTTVYPDLCAEWDFIYRYKAQWAGLPFPVQFQTVDAIVVCSGHVLVVERKGNPGKGLFALPGGFLKETETTQVAALRELREETGIRVDALILESAIQASKVFDHPNRSLRGRTISHGFLLKLRDGKLPEVKGGDDASRAFWMPFLDVAKNEDKFFDDHASIIHFFLNYS